VRNSGNGRGAIYRGGAGASESSSSSMSNLSVWCLGRIDREITRIHMNFLGRVWGYGIWNSVFIFVSARTLSDHKI
jgi:hypothetical protein